MYGDPGDPKYTETMETGRNLANPYGRTKYMIEENRNGKIDIDNLKRIREILLYFEDEYKNEKDRKGKLLIKRTYKNNRIDLF